MSKKQLIALAFALGLGTVFININIPSLIYGIVCGTSLTMLCVDRRLK